MPRSRLASPFAAIALAAVAGAVPSSSRADVAVAMRIVDDLANPESTSGEPFTGERSLFVIVDEYPACSAYEFGLSTTFELVAVIPPPGFVNAQNDPLNPYIFPEDPSSFTCPTYACELIVRDPTGDGGEICFAPSQERGRACFSPCNAPGWNRPDGHFGYRTVIGVCPQFDPACGPISVDESTWTETKATYR